MKIIALVLTYNSEKFIGKVLDSIPKKLFSEIICSDDGSKDQTTKIIKERNFKFIKAETNGGYGSNLFRGLKACFDEGATHVVEIHGDGQYDLNFYRTCLKNFQRKRLSFEIDFIKKKSNRGCLIIFIMEIISLHLLVHRIRTEITGFVPWI